MDLVAGKNRVDAGKDPRLHPKRVHPDNEVPEAQDAEAATTIDSLRKELDAANKRAKLSEEALEAVKKREQEARRVLKETMQETIASVKQETQKVVNEYAAHAWASYQMSLAPIAVSGHLTPTESARAEFARWYIHRHEPFFVSDKCDGESNNLLRSVEQAQAMTHALHVDRSACEEVNANSTIRVYTMSAGPVKSESVVVTAELLASYLVMNERTATRPGDSFICNIARTATHGHDDKMLFAHTGARLLVHTHGKCEESTSVADGMRMFAPNLYGGPCSIGGHDVLAMHDAWQKDIECDSSFETLALLSASDVICESRLCHSWIGDSYRADRVCAFDARHIGGMESVVQFEAFHQACKDAQKVMEEAKRTIQFTQNSESTAVWTRVLEPITSAVTHVARTASKSLYKGLHSASLKPAVSASAMSTGTMHTAFQRTACRIACVAYWMLRHKERGVKQALEAARVIHEHRRPLSFASKTQGVRSDDGIHVAMSDAFHARNHVAFACMWDMHRLHTNTSCVHATKKLEPSEPKFAVLRFSAPGVTPEAITCSMNFILFQLLHEQYKGHPAYPPEGRRFHEASDRRQRFDFTVFDHTKNGVHEVVFVMHRFHYFIANVAAHLYWRFSMTVCPRAYSPEYHRHIGAWYAFYPLVYLAQQMTKFEHPDGEFGYVDAESRKWASDLLWKFSSVLAKQAATAASARIASGDTNSVGPLNEAAVTYINRLEREQFASAPESPETSTSAHVQDVLLCNWQPSAIDADDMNGAVCSRLALVSVNGDVHFADNSMLISTLPGATCDFTQLWNANEHTNVTDAYTQLRQRTPLAFSRFFECLWRVAPGTAVGREMGGYIEHCRNYNRAMQFKVALPAAADAEV